MAEHLELRQVVNFVDRLTALYFTAKSVVYTWEIIYDLSAKCGSYHLY
jgi:hypothetical protein